jgi:hypothetical protein
MKTMNRTKSGELAKLRVKIVSLADEIRTIKREGKRLTQVRRIKNEHGHYVNDPKYLVVRFRNDALRFDLRRHREELGQEYRCALLAYLFLRGKRYDSQEKRPKYGYQSGKAWVEPNWERVAQLVCKFGMRPSSKANTEKVLAWPQQPVEVK